MANFTPDTFTSYSEIIKKAKDSEVYAIINAYYYSMPLDNREAFIKHLKKKLHPDVGGTEGKMVILNDINEKIRKGLFYKLSGQQDSPIRPSQPKTKSPKMEEVAYEFVVPYLRRKVKVTVLNINGVSYENEAEEANMQALVKKVISGLKENEIDKVEMKNLIMEKMIKFYKLPHTYLKSLNRGIRVNV